MPISVSGTTYYWPPTAAEVDQELNLGTDLSNDAELSGFIAAVAEVIENIVGPVNPTTFTEAHGGGAGRIVLRRYPVLDVTSIVEYQGTTSVPLTAQPLGTSVYDGNGYSLDAEDGVLSRLSGGTPARFAAGQDNVVVTYRAGRDEVPKDVRLAALQLIALHWRGQRAAGPSTLGLSRTDGDDDLAGATILGYFVPDKILELLAPARTAPRAA